MKHCHSRIHLETSRSGLAALCWPKYWPLAVLAVFLISINTSILASQKIADQYPQSPLYSKPIEVIPGVWSAIGATAPPDQHNRGHNNNLSFIVTGEGVVVVNAGASDELAQALHDEIRQVTDQPVCYVVNENGQGHAMLGNGYWTDLGVPIIAHREAAHEFAESGMASLAHLQKYNGEHAGGTRVVGPGELLDDRRTLTLGKFQIEVIWLGSAHSPGDLVVWLPRQKLVISGDMAFHERLLPVFENTDTKAWLESWGRFEALGAIYVIPGHGHPTNMDQVRLYTHDYLVFLRENIAQLILDGGDLQAAYKLDQSPYSKLDTFEELAAINAGRVFEQMEFE